jgi:catechol 2,3-dioxygenase-like lactoylglutathione lyase family enzyme
MSLTVKAINHTGMTIVNLENSPAFWRDLLGFTETFNSRLSGSFAEQVTGIKGADILFALLQGPGHVIELLQYINPKDHHVQRQSPNDVGSLHLALTVDSIEAVLAASAAFGWTTRGVPQTIADGAFAGTTFVYMQDPDGTIVELIQPPITAQTSAQAAT